MQDLGYKIGDKLICVESPESDEYSMEIGTQVTVSREGNGQPTIQFTTSKPSEWYRQELFIKLSDMYGKTKILGLPHGKNS